MNRYPDRVLAAGRGGCFAIGTRKSGGMFSLIGIGLGRKERAAAKAIGEGVAAMPWARNGAVPYLSRVERARGEAAQAARRAGLSQHVDGISGIAAHCAAGYGPISMLLEDQNVSRVVVRKAGRRITIFHEAFGECETNLAFSSQDEMERAVGAIERDAQCPGPKLLVDMQLDGSATITRAPGAKASTSGIIKEGFISKDLLAYMWMALDSDMNLAITGDRHGIRKALQAVAMLLPAGQAVSVCASDISPWLERGNCSIICSSISMAASCNADRIVIDELSGRHAAAVFSAAARGMPVVVGLPGVAHGSIPAALAAGAYSIDEARLSCLDIAVNARGARGIDAATEYSWFSRGEATLEECGAPCTPKALAVSSFAGSKLIQRYSDKYAIAIGDALREAELRAAFLEGSAPHAPGREWLPQKLK